MNLSEDHVVRSFYEERKGRDPSAKRHSLLKKNLSYFSPSQQQEDTKPPQKYIERRNNLNRYE